MHPKMGHSVKLPFKRTFTDTPLTTYKAYFETALRTGIDHAAQAFDFAVTPDEELDGDRLAGAEGTGLRNHFNSDSSSAAMPVSATGGRSGNSTTRLSFPPIAST